ncbi:MAG: phenylalanine--tRNA ligase subunit beta, partial [Chloroflexi bacterium]|nr:phenylalanine--tRNA ligase subunit beta [Chloroflexota bacterium]
MYVSMNWIKEHIDIPESVTIDEIVDKLTKASVEVDGINRIGEWWEPGLIQVGLVKEIMPHPNADRLRLADIELAKSETQRVVCGAPNLAIGQKIVFAKTGSKVYSPKTNGFITLETAKIRGVESSGMVLSESELGISDNHEGILVLDDKYDVGTSAQSILADTILDVHIWPNRPDLMNIIGIAREIDAIFNATSTLTLPDTSYKVQADKSLPFPNIEIDDYTMCSRYTGMLIKDVTIKESPQWLQDKLRSAGMRPIYNVVDITNFVMMEMGQPLHSFDYDKLNGTIKVRSAKKNEKLETLDGEIRELISSDLVIADDQTAIALAGVMGGANSDISDATKNVFLEAANFNPNNIRRTSQKFDLRSEASARFERNLPPHLALLGVQRAAKLIAEICGGTIIHELVDVNKNISDKRSLVKMNIETVQKICGIKVSEEEVLKKLQLLGFELDSKKNNDLMISVPLWRTDITIVDDLIEEFIRVYGYDTVPSVAINGEIPDHDLQDIVSVKSQLQDLFVAQGFNEIISYSLTTVDKLKIILGDAAVIENPPIALKNTLSSERSVLRTSMRHSLLETISYNIHNGQSDIWIFESGRIYTEKSKDITGTFAESPLAEQEYLVGAISAQSLDRFGLP